MRTRDRKAARRRSPSENPTPVLTLFVYGTLKRGYRNRQAFCRGFVEFREATVRGRLYEGPGYPILKVPEADILAQGTTDPLADAATQARLSNGVQARLQQPPEGTTGKLGTPSTGNCSPLRTPRLAFPPSTAWRDSAPVTAASIGACSSLPPWRAPASLPGSTW